MADELLPQNHLDHGGISSALAAHLIGRIGAVDRDLDEFIEYIGFVDKASALRAIQLMPLTDESLEVPEDFWTRPLVVTEKVTQSWGVVLRRIATPQRQAP